jgi:Pro-kumamolisin, activation domain
MLQRPRALIRSILLLLLCNLAPIPSWSQAVLPASRIVQNVNESALVALRGNTHPLAQAQFDAGAAPPDLPMARMLLVLQRSGAQEAALQKLLDDQQDRNSPAYHQWLTPDAFGQQFGPSDQDIQAITAWLQSHGFRVTGAGRGRTTIEFSGTALQVQQAFHTEIHKYVVNGREHWANASDPEIPQALGPVVAGLVSLHNFPKQPMHRVAGVFSRSRATGEVRAQNPDYTLPDPNNCQISNYCNRCGIRIRPLTEPGKRSPSWQSATSIFRMCAIFGISLDCPPTTLR